MSGGSSVSGSTSSITGVISIVLAGGYGQRLQDDVRKDPKYVHLADLNKALLPLPTQRTTLLDVWLNDELPPRIDNLPSRQNVTIIATNDFHLPQFLEWKSSKPTTGFHIFSDGTNTNETRLG